MGRIARGEDRPVVKPAPKLLDREPDLGVDRVGPEGSVVVPDAHLVDQDERHEARYEPDERVAHSPPRSPAFDHRVEDQQSEQEEAFRPGQGRERRGKAGGGQPPPAALGVRA